MRPRGIYRIGRFVLCFGQNRAYPCPIFGPCQYGGAWHFPGLKVWLA
jgi:hypothetical protein